MLFQLHKNFSRMINYFNHVSGQQNWNENDDGSEKYIAGIIVLVILLVILLGFNVYFIYHTRLKSPNTEAKPETNDNNSSKNIFDMPSTNYENVEDDHSTYTALQRPAPGESSDKHVYAHLNEPLKNAQKT